MTLQQRIESMPLPEDYMHRYGFELCRDRILAMLREAPSIISMNDYLESLSEGERARLVSRLIEAPEPIRPLDPHAHIEQMPEGEYAIFVRAAADCESVHTLPPLSVHAPPSERIVVKGREIILIKAEGGYGWFWCAKSGLDVLANDGNFYRYTERSTDDWCFPTESAATDFARQHADPAKERE